MCRVRIICELSSELAPKLAGWLIFQAVFQELVCQQLGAWGVGFFPPGSQPLKSLHYDDSMTVCSRGTRLNSN
jgi:hypothetical protein